MAKRKPSTRRPQAQHRNANQKSRHDKRERLTQPNPGRRKTKAARFPLVGDLKTLVTTLVSRLDSRLALRLTIIIAGMLLARGRRTASAWFMAAGVKDDWDRFYDCLISVGKQIRKPAEALVGILIRKLAIIDGVIRLALDDSPTSRFGRHVEGAGVHHNPTRGPADGEWLYGHSWVALAWLARHPLWGTVALPLLSMLYVRQADVAKLPEKHDWKFKTKLELGVEMLQWLAGVLKRLGIEAHLWLAVDGAYAKASFLRPLCELGVVVFSRLRSDACLYDLPPARKPGQRGRPRTYGKNKLSLKKRAGQRRGWQSVTYNCRGQQVTRQYKTFLATSRLTGGIIRVVIMKFDKGWAAYFCTRAGASVVEILEMLGDRWAIEEHFHDAKEVHGAGQQQVRNIWSNIACWNLIGWLSALIELCVWDDDESKLKDRRARPWDNPARRPSHADRKRTIARKMLAKQFLAAQSKSTIPRKIKTMLNCVIKLAA